MPNDLIPSGGVVAPYIPASGGLPASSDPLGGTIDYLSDHSGNHPPQLFGVPLQAGATSYHVDAALSQISAVFASDMEQLKASPQFVNQAIAVFKQLAVSPVSSEVPIHDYNLTNLPPIPASDMPHIVAFCNQMKRENADQEDVRKAIYWMGLLYQKLGQAQTQSQAQTPMAGKPVEKVSESEYRSILKNQDQAIINCQEKLKDLWGQKYQTNLNIAINYFRNSLTVEEQNHLQSAVIGNTMALNNPEVIRRMYMLATSGGQSQGLQSLQNEREVIEQMIKTNRRKYNNSPEIQSRYREIIDAMGG